MMLNKRRKLDHKPQYAWLHNIFPPLYPFCVFAIAIVDERTKER